MKKLIMLFHKYVCGRLDLYEHRIQPNFPVIAYGELLDDTEVIGSYFRWVLPLFRFGFEPGQLRRLDVAAWRCPELSIVRWIDTDLPYRQVQLNDIIWEEDDQRTLDEEVRRRNKLNDGFIYSHDNKWISCRSLDRSSFDCLSTIIEYIATEHLEAGQAVYLDPDNPGRLIPCRGV